MHTRHHLFTICHPTLLAIVALSFLQSWNKMAGLNQTSFNNSFHHRPPSFLRTVFTEFNIRHWVGSGQTVVQPCCCRLCRSQLAGACLECTLNSLVHYRHHHHHHHHLFVCPIIQQYAHLHRYNFRRAGQQGPTRTLTAARKRLIKQLLGIYSITQVKYYKRENSRNQSFQCCS